MPIINKTIIYFLKYLTGKQDTINNRMKERIALLELKKEDIFPSLINEISSKILEPKYQQKHNIIARIIA